MIPTYRVQIVPKAACVTLYLPREHRQRVIEIIEWLRLRVHEYLAAGIDPSPFLEKPGGEFRCDSEAGDRITAAALEHVLDALPGRPTRRNQNEVGKLAESCRRAHRSRGAEGQRRIILPLCSSAPLLLCACAPMLVF